VQLDGQLVTRFYGSPNWDKPFFYPLLTPQGRSLSRGYPVEPHPGDSQDHAWHRGLWYGHGDISQVDFWRELGAGKSGVFRLSAPAKRKARKDQTQLAFRLSMEAPDRRLLGSIEWLTQFRRVASSFQWDLDLRIQGAPSQRLRFGDTDDGGLGLRLREEFREDRGALLRNNLGGVGSKQIWGQEAKWVQYEATVDGAKAGVAIFDHSANPRHPTGWHARPYGLCSANPFALRSFKKRPDAQSIPDFELPAGETLRLRYRILLYDGEVSPADLDRRFTDFATT
jgi:hypothetical protein